MGKAMYQSAFLSFENSLNSVVISLVRSRLSGRHATFGVALRDIPKDRCEGD